METLWAIINSIPEPLAVAILTAAFTGTIIFYLQKKMETAFSERMKEIDLSIGKKLEEFKADLQLSNFQEQTKFVKNHEKALETLETLFQMFNDFKIGFNHFVIEVRKAVSSFDKAETLISMEEIEIQHKNLESVVNYYARNRHLLPISTLSTIQKIFATVNTLILLVQLADEKYYSKESLPEIIRYTILPSNSPYFVELSELNIRGVADKTITIQDLLSDIVQDMNRQGAILEGLYKKHSGIED